ncbi:HEAT repeat domain-containing protein [Undibacterium sp. Ji50W]|uniref:HEAT repeat domain-containing protein n=1 Tax=Undibacterium sp. Ji50W TaxID=3413041 RepID=UPI003BF25F81
MSQTYPWMTDVVHQFDGYDLEQKASWLKLLSDFQQDLPLTLQELICKAAQPGTSTASDENSIAVWSQAIIGLAKCHDLAEKAIAILRPCLQSEYWFIRGNAAVSLALLGVKDAVTIGRIGALLFDHEGFDWRVSEAALSALETIGEPAQQEVPQILHLASQYIQQDKLTGWSDMGVLIANCLAAIGDKSPAVIDSLCQMVEKRSMSAYEACVAIGMLNTKAEQAQQVIANYLCSEEMPAYDAERAYGLIDALESVASDRPDLIRQCLHHLLQSPFEEVVDIAKQRLDTY